MQVAGAAAVEVGGCSIPEKSRGFLKIIIFDLIIRFEK
jgi:hypothetical protein